MVTRPANITNIHFHFHLSHVVAVDMMQALLNLSQFDGDVFVVTSVAADSYRQTWANFRASFVRGLSSTGKQNSEVFV